MKVSDVMSKHVEYVSSETKVKDVCKLIFVEGVNGLPICLGKKVVGFITERDILAKLFPSVAEYMEDPVHAVDFEGMEKRVDEIFNLEVKEIMSSSPALITQDSPLMKAESTMLVKKVGRLPVIDDKGSLVGIISRGDIFRTVVGNKLPFPTDEEYHDWLSKHYDLVVDWNERLKYETADLISLFDKEKANKILDIGCGTGEHDIALAKEGFRATGIESSRLMYESALKKLREMPQISARLNFISARGDYINVLKSQEEKYDAAIFMGNAFAHLAGNHERVLKAVSNILTANGLIVLQLINFNKVFNVNKRFLSLNFSKSENNVKERAFLEFYDPPRNKDGFLSLNMATFEFREKKWGIRSINSTPIADLSKEKISKLLEEEGFAEISFYGSNFWGPLFKEPFDSLKSDWLNVVAKRV